MRTAKQSKALPPQLAPRLIDRDAAAAYLGLPLLTFKAVVNVSALRIGNRTLYDKSDLDAWVEQQKNTASTVDQILSLVP